MSKEEKCSCSNGPTLFYACSGASDVGAISDLTARSLTRQEKGWMSCATAIAADITDLVDKAKSASKIMVIDGCPKDCAKKVFEKGGFDDIIHIQLCDLGLKKGQSPANDENVETAVNHCISNLG